MVSLEELVQWRRRAALDPPQAVGRRFVQTVVRTGLVRLFLSGNIPDVVQTWLREGMDAGSLHRLYAAAHPDRLAAVDSERSVTYREIDEEIDGVVRGLRDRFGLEAGDPVALMMENRIEYVAAWFATFRAGFSAVHVSYRATPDELEYQLEHSGARVVVTSESSLETVRAVRARRDDWEVAVVLAADTGVRDARAYREFVEHSGDDIRSDEGVASDADSGGNIVYTSGTTGRPKGTVRDMTALGIHDLFRIIERLPVRAGDRHLVVAPMYHSGGQVFTLLNASLGATIHLEPKFDPDETLEVLSERAIHSLFLVPTMLRRLLEAADETEERHRMPAFRCLVSGAAPFPEPLRRRAMRRFGTRSIHDFYGATELGWVTLINGREMRERPGSVGRPIAGQEVTIVDDGEPCEPGEVGTIYVRSLHTMEGYLADDAANDEFWHGEWATVDDLGYLDEEGYLYLAGRERDMVISGGVNVYPVEIEDVLVDHPDVEDAGVIGVEDEEWGEKLVAYVVPTGDSANTETLDEHVRDRLAGYKVPKEWVLVDELPRNPTGKIRKTELESRYDASGDGSG